MHPTKLIREAVNTIAAFVVLELLGWLLWFGELIDELTSVFAASLVWFDELIEGLTLAVAAVALLATFGIDSLREKHFGKGETDVQED